MTVLTLHLSVALPGSADTKHVTLLILATMITLALAGIRGLLRRTQVVMVITGTSALLVVLSVLVVAYLITLGTP
ncbi:hypothetical protein [Nonomuraea zeae]|uniref:Uncharacterized protein n=1 Tax=Nonomuraea zeae TaxID=1642303 RepID=A0A5S4GZ18_9ACTN|nr:hypothetical protein [Nonomuraea zeae]TMR37781.1 hypothetical protein ETD85_07160 [Nonomuraea zeae]